MKFVGQGRCEDVLTYPLHVASVYRFCSSVPEFVVSLPSLLASQQTSLRLTNWLHQLANERLALSGILKVSSIPLPMLGAHKMFLQWCRDELVLSSIFVQRFVSWDRTRLRKGTTAETQTL